MLLLQGDCKKLLRTLPDSSVDLVITDPPYEFHSGKGGGAFGREKRSYHGELYDGGNLDKGISNTVLEELVRVMKKINIYIWCNKNQLRQYMDFFEDRGATTELLTWHKTNPVPTCNNKYLSDTEYILFFRGKGVNIYGEYKTKHKYYVTPTNKQDKLLWGHPTVKPEGIIENLILNSSKEGEMILDPFMGSGTTGAVAKRLGRDFTGFEIEEQWFNVAKRRIENGSNLIPIEDESNQPTMF